MTVTARPQRPATLAQTINQALDDLMARDNRVLLIGEDIGRLGGVFRVTSGLLNKYGPQRVRNSILAESAIVGQAIGMSIAGLIPICEIQFDGFTFPATNQLVANAPRISQRWDGVAGANIIVRIPSGAGTRAVEHHSESNEAMFARVPNLRVGCPSTGEDYVQMLSYAVETGGPTLIYEPIRLYHKSKSQPRTQTPDPAPLAARVIRPGDDLTLVCYGAITQESLKAAASVAGEVSVEVIDLRWVAPLDIDTVLASVKKTGRLLMVHEGGILLGVGAEVTAQIAERAWDDLRAPIRRLAPPSVNYPPADEADGYMVNQQMIVDKIKECVA